MSDRVRVQPCEACPYRKDVASGVWVADEYAKLPPYDAPTDRQPFEPFGCHATPEFFCHGWAVVHSRRGHDHELLALRLAAFGAGHEIAIPEPAVPLFDSGAEAAEHGLRDLRRPKKAARDTQQRLLKRYARLRKKEAPDQ